LVNSVHMHVIIGRPPGIVGRRNPAWRNIRFIAGKLAGEVRADRIRMVGTVRLIGKVRLPGIVAARADP